MHKALLFINGNAPKKFPNLEKYHCIACTDGAFHYLKALDFPIDKLTFVSGDFDSHQHSDFFHSFHSEIVEESETLRQAKYNNFEIIETPDQNKTDFEKALEILIEKGISDVDVFGGSGGEQDHFLGNLSVASKFKDQLNITFFDEFSQYFFIPKNFSVSGIRGRLISLYPFPFAKNILTKGLEWELHYEDLSIIGRIGTRNKAQENEISITYSEGDLLIFIGV